MLEELPYVLQKSKLRPSIKCNSSNPENRESGAWRSAEKSTMHSPDEGGWERRIGGGWPGNEVVNQRNFLETSLLSIMRAAGWSCSRAISQRATFALFLMPARLSVYGKRMKRTTFTRDEAYSRERALENGETDFRAFLEPVTRLCIDF